MRQSFFYITKKWGGSRINIIFKFARIFETDLQKILDTQGYLHCTNMNYLLRVMAVRSNLFTESDITLKLTNTWFVSIHQFLQIKTSEKNIISLDPWNYQFGIPYGNYGSGGDSTKINAIK